MKLFFLTSVFLISTQVFALHPEDTDILSNIGTGTEIQITTDINLKPNTLSTKIGSGDYLNCYIEVRKPESYDRVISSGTIYTVTFQDSKSVMRWDTETLYLDGDEGETIICTRTDYQGGQPTNPIKIGEFKNLTNKFLKVKLAAPKKI